MARQTEMLAFCRYSSLLVYLLIVKISSSSLIPQSLTENVNSLHGVESHAGLGEIASTDSFIADAGADTDSFFDFDADDDTQGQVSVSPNTNIIEKRATRRVFQAINHHYSVMSTKLCFLCFVLAPMSGRRLTEEERYTFEQILGKRWKDYAVVKTTLDHYKRTMFKSEDMISEEWHEEVCSDIVKKEIHNRVMDNYIGLMFKQIDAKHEKNEKDVQRYTAKWNTMSKYVTQMEAGMYSFTCSAQDERQMKKVRRIQERLGLDV